MPKSKRSNEVNQEKMEKKKSTKKHHHKNDKLKLKDKSDKSKQMSLINKVSSFLEQQNTLSNSNIHTDNKFKFISSEIKPLQEINESHNEPFISMQDMQQDKLEEKEEEPVFKVHKKSQSTSLGPSRPFVLSNEERKRIGLYYKRIPINREEKGFVVTVDTEYFICM
ncbi:hypothetical protein WA158_000066 [Blastocystis sp. Blastoise]